LGWWDVTYRQNVLWLAPFVADTVNLGMDGARDEFLHALGSVILERRNATRFGSQGTLAKAMGVSEPTVRRWESGLSCPDAWQVKELARLLLCDELDFLRPEPISARERALLKRAAKQTSQTIRRELEDAG